MKLHRISLKDKKIFRQYLGQEFYELAVYAFQDIYIWKGLFDIRWSVVNGCLCIFFKDKIGCFLYLPPLGKDKSRDLLNKVFAIMDKFNKNKEVSRIENISEEDIGFYRRAGYDCRFKSYDYLCSRDKIAGLSGNKFKSQRASYNYFVKHYNFKFQEFKPNQARECLRLYSGWMKQRRNPAREEFYQGMMEDSLVSFKAALKDCRHLDLTGAVVEIEKEIKAFTFGYRLNPGTFCILYEITDLSIKGLAQFIFREFCRRLRGYKYINIMDDSGLANLKKVKLSYHPDRLIPAYIAKRN